MRSIRVRPDTAPRHGLASVHTCTGRGDQVIEIRSTSARVVTHAVYVHVDR